MGVPHNRSGWTIDASSRMDTAENSFSTLARVALETGSARWLDCPLAELAQHADLPWSRHAFFDLHAAGRADTLREALRDDLLVDWVKQTRTIAETWSVIHQLRVWLGIEPSSKNGSDNIARLAAVRPPPQTKAALVAWARAHGVEAALTRPMSLAAPETASEAQGMSVLDAAISNAKSHRPSQAELYLAYRAGTYLHVTASSALAPAARDKLWLRKAPNAATNFLASQLRTLASSFDRCALDAAQFAQAHPVELDADSGICQAMVRTETEIEVTLQLDGFERNVPIGTCAACGASMCVHQSALAARMLDACLDKRDRLHASVLQLTRVPSWQRLLSRLDNASQQSWPARPLSFEIECKDSQVFVGVLGKPEQSSAWQLTAARKVLRRTGSTAPERAVLTAIARCAKTLGAERVPADLAVLRELQGKACVPAESDNRRVHLREQRISLHFHEGEDGLSPQLELAGKPVSSPSAGDYVYDCTQDTVTFAAVTPALRNAVVALQGFRGSFPSESFAALATWAAQWRNVVDVVLPRSVASRELPTPSKLLLRVVVEPRGGISVWLGMQALPLSPYWAPGHGDEVLYALQDGELVFARRDLALERALGTKVVDQLGVREHQSAEMLFGKGNTAQLARCYPIPDEQHALEALSIASRLTNELDIEWVDTARRIRPPHKVRASDLTVTLLKKGDWLELRGSVLADHIQIGLQQLLQAAKEGLRFVRVEGPSYVEIEQTLFERLEQAQWTAHLTKSEIHIILGAANHWLEQLGDQIEPGDHETAVWLPDARGRALAVNDSPLPLSDRLRPYQAAGVRWLLQRSAWAPGACLADEMGLGKTIQTIAVVAARMSLGPALIVSPTSLIANWLSELGRFAPALRAQAYHGPSRQHCQLEAGTVTVTSYDIVLRDSTELAKTHFATVVLDEAQFIRNADAKRARALTTIPADFRIALTGTPIENRIGDLWSIFHVIAPGLLGPRNRFRKLLSVPIDRYQNEQRAQQLRAVVEPLLLRRTKREVAPELPERIEVVHEVELSKPERALYTAAVARLRRAFRGKKSERDKTGIKSALAELTILRQLACHPRLVIPDSRIESSKLAVLLTMLADILPRGHRVLVFSQFVAHLALVQEALVKRNIAYLYLDGSVPALERQRIVERFQRGEADVLLISLKAGGTGLNLTQADYVIHMDPWWNPAAEDQASDRAHRIGQTRPVSIVKLVSRDTIEEQVVQLHQHKRWVAQSVLLPDLLDTHVQSEAVEAALRQ